VFSFSTNRTQGRLTLEEFVEFIQLVFPGAESSSDNVYVVMQVIDAFRQMDLAGRGVITFKEFSGVTTQARARM
jgi:Ca2+-binding EF-hand superfamily protein